MKSVSDDGTAQVLLRRSACSEDCHQCAGCGAKAQRLMLTARNPIGAKPGDWVTIRTGTSTVLEAAAVVYVLPVILFFLGYLLGTLIWQAGALLGGIAFVLGIAAAVVYDRRSAVKKKITYTITGYGQAPAWGKEDKDFD